MILRFHGIASCFFGIYSGRCPYFCLRSLWIGIFDWYDCTVHLFESVSDCRFLDFSFPVWCTRVMVLVSWACVLQCCWYWDDPIMRYHVFVVKLDYTLVDWSFLYCELLHYVLICYLCTTLDSLGILPRDICPFQRYLYHMYDVHFWVVIVFTSWNMCHVNIVCFSLFFPVASVLSSSGGSMCGSRSSVIAATLSSPFRDVYFGYVLDKK